MALAELHSQVGLVKEEFRVAEELGGRDLSELVPQRSRGVLMRYMGMIKVGGREACPYL